MPRSIGLRFFDQSRNDVHALYTEAVFCERNGLAATAATEDKEIARWEQLIIKQCPLKLIEAL